MNFHPSLFHNTGLGSHIFSETCMNDDIIHILNEAVVMGDFNHPNVLGLLGVAVDQDLGLPMLLMPYMSNGDVNTYLRKFRYDEEYKEKVMTMLSKYRKK